MNFKEAVPTFLDRWDNGSTLRPKVLTNVGQKTHPFLDSVFLHFKIHQKFEPKIGFKIMEGEVRLRCPIST
jgi:hypothetical protein